MYLIYVLCIFAIISKTVDAFSRFTPTRVVNRRTSILFAEGGKADDQSVKDLDLEQMFDVFEEAENASSDGPTTEKKQGWKDPTADVTLADNFAPSGGLDTICFYTTNEY